ncbi:cyclin dependent kinase inhibitor 1Bb [Anableps anableps]
MKTGRSWLLEDSAFLGGKMSDVRLSNGSPTLERTEPRVTEHPKPSACRSLFGSVDHEELKRDLKGHMRELQEAASAKWGFDFANDKPLPNARLTWELVDSAEIPDFYVRPPRKEKGVCSGNNHVDLNGNHNCVLVVPSEDTSMSDVLTECTEQCTGLRKRPCHDTTAQSKRSRSSPGEVSCPTLSHSVEHTPRKSSPKRQT